MYSGGGVGEEYVQKAGKKTKKNFQRGFGIWHAVEKQSLNSLLR